MISDLTGRNCIALVTVSVKKQKERLKLLSKGSSIVPSPNTKLIFLATFLVALAVFYDWLYQWNYVESKDAMFSVMANNMLVYAQQHNETDEELHRITQDPIKESVAKNPEGARIAEIVDQTEEVRKTLPLIESARSPLQFVVVNDTGKGDMLDTIPFTKPGQIYIDIRSGSGDLSIANNHSDWIPLSWSGNMLFDAGTDQKSIGGIGWNRFVMDCPPGSHFGVTAQKDTESGLLEVSTYANEVDGNDKRLPMLWHDTLPYGQTEETGKAYGIITISDVCPEPNKQPTTN